MKIPTTYSQVLAWRCPYCNEYNMSDINIEEIPCRICNGKVKISYCTECDVLNVRVRK